MTRFNAFWMVVLEKTLESLLDCKKIQPDNPKGNQLSIFIGGIDVEAETPIRWPPDVDSWLIGKDPDAGRDWGQEDKGTTEDEMAEWHHRLNGCESEWTPGAGDGQGGLACCSPWGRQESDTTALWLHWLTTGSLCLVTTFTHFPPAVAPPLMMVTTNLVSSTTVLFHVRVRSYSICLSLS